MKKILFILTMCFAASSFYAQEDLKGWFHVAPTDGLNGVASDKAYIELLKNKKSTPVVVAIIDSGIDIEHEDLADNIWVNEDEIPGNGIDDDNNGYVDDVNGWNFIGGPNGKNVGAETYEVTRLYGKYRYKFENAKPELLNKKDRKLYDQWLTWKEEVDSKRAGAESYLNEMEATEERLFAAFDALGASLEKDSLEFSKENISGLNVDSDPLAQIGREIAINVLSEEDIKSIDGLKTLLSKELEGEKVRQQNKLDYAYNPDYDSRKEIVKDNYADGNERIYGNNDVEGPDALHGTHVAGIVGAVRGNDLGMNGVADNVQLMSIRAVPDGDERDKDVANSIRYAVDNGASIINMSFGKGHSWDEKLVEDAIKYAAKHDVLLVHAAGNSAQDNDKVDNFPNPTVKRGWLCKKHKPAKNWIEVGALSYGKGDESVAIFSNYGNKMVDLFAPGVKIYATTPDNNYRFLQGTSMASPVVAGVATVIRSYFPALTAEQVKEILESTVTVINGDVNLPGDEGKTTTLSQLCETGGVVNLYNAVKKAMVTKGKKKIKKSNEGA